MQRNPKETPTNLPAGDKYIASEKQVRRSFRSSVLLKSCMAICGGELANPTPASLLRRNKFSTILWKGINKGKIALIENKLCSSKDSEDNTGWNGEIKASSEYFPA